MQVQRIVNDILGTNTYLISDSHFVFAIDPGSNANEIIRDLKSLNRPVDAILITHGHFDHIFSCYLVQKEFGCDVFMSKKDENGLKRTEFFSFISGFGRFKLPERINPLETAETIFGDLNIHAYPGHTPGSHAIEINSCFFSGDIYLRNLPADTKIPFSNSAEEKASAEKFKINTVGKEIFPGHGKPYIMGA